tara:strand:+ start:5437 stop:6180 length:744 start_codon:yes stop_codon:yes gene_type:complete
MLELLKEEEVVVDVLTAKAIAESKKTSHACNNENINQPISSFNDLNLIDKFIKGKEARKKWCKDISEYNSIDIDIFNESCGNIFTKISDINLDTNPETRIVLKVNNILDNAIWVNRQDVVYIITKNREIMKIGGTRTGMRDRWASYLCGHCVPQRKKKNGENYPGKMSVTNAHLYHTIEDDLLRNNSEWEFYIYICPPALVNINFVGDTIAVQAQVYHAYESILIKKFTNITGNKPILCSASDPTYR